MNGVEEAIQHRNLVLMRPIGRVTKGQGHPVRASHDGHEPMEWCIVGENAKDIGIYYTHMMRSDGDVQQVGRQ
jgi:hypothetical protein